MNTTPNSSPNTTTNIPTVAHQGVVNPYLVQFKKGIEERSAQIGIIGLGYVGLPLALRYAECGFRVVGLDINEDHVQKINAGHSYISTIKSERIALQTERLKATSNPAALSECQAIIIAVPTPLSKQREPDLSFVLKSVESVLPHLRKGQLVSLESTTYPGTTDEELKPRLEKAGFHIGQDLFLVFSPEREDPGNPNYETATIPKVCGGVTPSCLEAGVSLYSAVIHKVVPVSSARAAELTKLLENIHRSVNIGLMNEMKILSHKMDIDIFEVIRAAATKPFGFTAYYPGPGLGGHCIPIDPFYLTWKAREFGLNTRFIELAGEINTAMPDWVMDRVVSALNDRQKSVKGSKVLVLGIAYKKNVNDMRESPSVALMERLRDRGADLSFSDPYFTAFPKMREHRFDLSSVKLDAKTLSTYDCVLLATDHDQFDYEMIQSSSSLIIDTRGRYQQSYPNVIRA